MMFKLPLEPSESAVLWDGEDGGERSRIRIECVERGRWMMHTEQHQAWGDEGSEDDEWCAGSIPLSGLQRSWTTLGLALRGHMTTGYQFMRAFAKPKKPRLESKWKRLASVTGGGWWVKWRIVGDGRDGPWVEFDSKRALDADEWVVVLEQLAKALDDWDKRFGGLA